MITPRTTRLIRVPELQTFRRAIADLAPRASHLPAPLVIVPTRSAARLLTRSVAADVVTRDEMYDRLHARLVDPPRRLTPLERDVMAQAAARAAAAVVSGLSFTLRPGLIAEMLRFYDQLRRQSQQVRRFEELIDEALGSDDVDRATQRMRTQTRFLAAAFRDYERRVRESTACDEHTLRERLVAEPSAAPIRHVIVTIPDWIADAQGLYQADFDLLTRIPGLASLDIVSTERVLASGFHERLHNWWPGLEETDLAGVTPSATHGAVTGVAQPPATDVAQVSATDGAQAFRPARPVLVTPPNAPPDEPWWTLRDREEELVTIARQLKADRRNGDAMPLDRVAIVYKNPLPYLYAAAEIFRAAGIPYRMSDALPLAAEPTSAALDLILDTVSSRFSRSTLIALLRSPHFLFPAVTRHSVSELDRSLSAARYLGDVDRLDALAGEWGSGASRPALDAALAVAHGLAPLTEPHPASEQIACLLACWSAHARPIGDEDPFASRERRARAAILDMLPSLAAVHAAHDDPAWTIDDLSIAVRRWIEDQTFVPEADERGGVHLLDDQAVRYAGFDDVAIVGVVDQDWPERPRRNIFYPPALLKSLGWPSEKDRRAAGDARFLDLLTSASRRTTVSTFTLDEDAIVSRSMQLDEIPRARLSTVARERFEDARVFADEALSLDPIAFEPFEGDARRWAEMRTRRSPADSPGFHGTVSGIEARSWSVSAIETYLDCPFKFFAQHVLKLEEEPEDQEVMDPRRQGQFVHQVFERFFDAWQTAGRRTVTPENLDAAREMFTAVVDAALGQLPIAEAGLERTRLLGSSAAAGLGEAVLRMEAERPVAVVGRLLEEKLIADFVFATADGPRTIALRGKADRIDLLEDGTFRLIDYKLGWPPQRGRALQLPIYSLCAEQKLAGYKGRNWRLGEAAYLAFKGPKRVVPLFAAAADRGKVLAEAQQRLADTVAAIERGEFPPTPDDVWRCETCSFASVCRKDYVGDV
ncbi:MAG: double-strand break repair protein AddB [Acidobacteria bacterium]|nr:double-strand break repair protein AddB [Acidobacteriota bacterium]